MEPTIEIAVVSVVREQRRDFAKQLAVAVAGFAHVRLARGRIATQSPVKNLFNPFPAFHGRSFHGCPIRA